SSLENDEMRFSSKSSVRSHITAEQQYKSDKFYLPAQLCVGLNSGTLIIYNYEQVYSGCRRVLMEYFCELNNISSSACTAIRYPNGLEAIPDRNHSLL
ncbi:hypothetical protein N9383_07160, partial [Granulosicoccus sp.]|nr:hypothetical protein [Granulosicoccus sp.]